MNIRSFFLREPYNGSPHCYSGRGSFVLVFNPCLLARQLPAILLPPGDRSCRLKCCLHRIPCVLWLPRYLLSKQSADMSRGERSDQPFFSVPQRKRHQFTKPLKTNGYISLLPFIFTYLPMAPYQIKHELHNIDLALFPNEHLALNSAPSDSESVPPYTYSYLHTPREGFRLHPKPK